MTGFVCSTCGYPSRSGADACDNPACVDNPSLSEAHKQKLRDAEADYIARRAEEEERLAFKRRLKSAGPRVQKGKGNA